MCAGPGAVACQLAAALASEQRERCTAEMHMDTCTNELEVPPMLSSSNKSSSWMSSAYTRHGGCGKAQRVWLPPVLQLPQS